VKQNEWHKQL